MNYPPSIGKYLEIEVGNLNVCNCRRTNTHLVLL
jgi:hypothetical protein